MEYQTFFRVPQLTDTVDADVQFFPEGGYLLAGIRSQINLKAVGTDGFGIDIYGCIYGKTTGMVTPFASSHRGMGRFTFEVKEGEEYYAMVKMPDETEKKVELPQVKQQTSSFMPKFRILSSGIPVRLLRNFTLKKNYMYSFIVVEN